MEVMGLVNRVLGRKWPKFDTAVFRVFRYDPDDGRPGTYEAYRVPVKEGMTVLDGLMYIVERLDGSLSFRSSCRSASCGSCAMYINGRHELACRTGVKTLGPSISVGPLPHLPVIKDLVADMEPFFERYRRIEPYLMPAGERDGLQTQRQRRELGTGTDCILCACCDAACPITLSDERYLGPAALLASHRFIRDSRDSAKGRRLGIAASTHGVWRCHGIFNCVEVCPKDLRPGDALQELRRLVIESGAGGEDSMELRFHVSTTPVVDSGEKSAKRRAKPRARS